MAYAVGGKKVGTGGGASSGERRLEAGWRFFRCSSCGCGFERASRDRNTPSMESCPGCLDEVRPVASRPDGSLKVDAYGNLAEYPEDRFYGPEQGPKGG